MRYKMEFNHKSEKRIRNKNNKRYDDDLIARRVITKSGLGSLWVIALFLT
jgi:hypothetical protein